MKQNIFEANYKNLERVCAWIENADFKASILLAFQGGLILLILEYSSKTTELIEKSSTLKSSILSLMFCIFTVGFALSIYNTLRVILSDVKPRNTKNRLFSFMTIAKYNNKTFIDKMSTIPEKDIIATLAEQTYINSTIANNKFEHLIKGWKYFISSFIFGLFLVLLEQLFLRINT